MKSVTWRSKRGQSVSLINSALRVHNQLLTQRFSTTVTALCLKKSLFRMFSWCDHPCTSIFILKWLLRLFLHLLPQHVPSDRILLSKSNYSRIHGFSSLCFSARWYDSFFFFLPRLIIRNSSSSTLNVIIQTSHSAPCAAIAALHFPVFNVMCVWLMITFIIS